MTVYYFTKIVSSSDFSDQCDKIIFIHVLNIEKKSIVAVCMVSG